MCIAFCIQNNQHKTSWIINLDKMQSILYEAVFISKLTCQLSSFFVQNFVQTTSTLCKERRQLCTNNVNFARTTTNLYEERRLCKDNVDFARTTTTLYEERRLCKENVNFARTTSTLQGQRRLCKDNVDFARTTTTLQGQRQLCQKFMYDPMKSPERLSHVCMAPWNFLRL